MTRCCCLNVQISLPNMELARVCIDRGELVSTCPSNGLDELQMSRLSLQPATLHELLCYVYRYLFCKYTSFTAIRRSGLMQGYGYWKWYWLLATARVRYKNPIRSLYMIAQYARSNIRCYSLQRIQFCDSSTFISSAQMPSNLS